MQRRRVASHAHKNTAPQLEPFFSKRWRPSESERVRNPDLIHLRRAEGRPLLISGLWIALALVLGARGAELGAILVPKHVSPVSSGDAVAVLSSISAGMIAFTGVVFSLTSLALQFASTSYSPRVIGELGQRRMLGHALGVFTGTFLYSLLAIGTVDRGGTNGVNVVVVATAMLWLFGSVVLFIMLLPRVAGISESHILARLGELGRDAASRLYASELPRQTTTVESDAPINQSFSHLGGPRYLVGFDVSRLSAEAAKCGGIVEIPHRIGAVILPGATLLRVRGGSAADGSEGRLRGALWLELAASTVNDPAYAVRLLVDIAIRGLSPAINDPTTAVDVLDQIQPILREIGAGEIATQRILYEDETPRVVFQGRSWEDWVDLALQEIRQYGEDSRPVRRRLRELGETLRAELLFERHAALQPFCD